MHAAIRRWGPDLIAISDQRACLELRLGELTEFLEHHARTGVLAYEVVHWPPLVQGGSRPLFLVGTDGSVLIEAYNQHYVSVPLAALVAFAKNPGPPREDTDVIALLRP